MKKRTNKLLSISVLIIMCFCMVFILSACTGSSNISESSSKASENTVSTASNQEESKTDTDTVSETKEPSQQASETESKSDSESKTEETTSKTLVVYFSHTGTTKGVSGYLHNVVGGDIVEFIPVNAYPEGYSDALEPAKQEQRDNARPAIANTIDNFDSYDVIYLGYPIWWGTTPMIINTFLESYDFSGKTVIPYATSGGTGIDQSIQDIRNEIPSADVKDGLLVKSNDEIEPLLKRLGII